MPRIDRGNPASSPSPEPTANATPHRSPETGGGNSAGRRERHGLLGFFARPFRGSGSSTRASAEASTSLPQEREQAPASRAAPRGAAALLQRSPVLSRGHGEEVMARVVRARAETPGPSAQGSPSRAPARGALTPQPASRRAPETQASAIVQQLRNAGIELEGVRRNIAAAMQNHPLIMDRRTAGILAPHFPDMFGVGRGFSSDNPLAVALHHALSLAAPQPQPTGGRVRNRQSPPPAAEAPAPAPGRQARGAAPSLLGRLAGSRIDMSDFAAAIDNAVLNGRALPDETRNALTRAGIETHVGSGRIPMNHPLLQLRREIHSATPQRDPSPPQAARMPRPARRRPMDIRPLGNGRATNAASIPARALVLPPRLDADDNAHYALRVYNQNPGASVHDVAAAVVGPSGGLNLQPTIDGLNALIRTHAGVSGQIRAAFSALRSISKADAERLGFKDAAIYNREGDGPFSRDDATTCMFGEELSTNNPSQHVIALATVPSSQRNRFDPGVNRGIVFMDLNKLADYLATKPKHPMNNNQPLNARNIRDFAFRID